MHSRDLMDEDGENRAMMTTAILWLLISISDGSRNRGDVQVLERFATQQDCFNVKAPIERSSNSVILMCQEARVVKP